MSFTAGLKRSLEGRRPYNLTGHSRQNVSADALHLENTQTPQFSQDMGRGGQSASASLLHAAGQPPIAQTNTDTLDPFNPAISQGIFSRAFPGRQEGMSGLISSLNASDNAGSPQEQLNPFVPAIPNSGMSTCPPSDHAGQTQSAPSSCCMLIYLVDDNGHSEDMMARRDNNVLTSGIYRDAIERVGLELRVHPHPNNQFNLTAQGFEGQGGQLVQVTLRNREGHGCVCKLTLMDRQNSMGWRDGMETDIVIGRDYIQRLPPLQAIPMSMQQGRDSISILGPRMGIAGRSLPSSGNPEYIQGYQNPSGYSARGWLLDSNQAQGLHPGYPPHMTCKTNAASVSDEVNGRADHSQSIDDDNPIQPG
ncbi:hypothetical protein NPX13_g2141 [Xylaria arbuscula]|uniref:Uncharacterized protein n=1 Tax=Xylaria arbuscula TaxID=114810 RepID=A0A9W8TPG0_9PEZI|nr:hypothetical protein NPX13_g2141 [Xylaria arbuscula]